MSVNFLDEIRKTIDQDVNKCLAEIIDEHPQKTQDAVIGAVPALVAAMLRGSSTTDGAEQVFRAVGEFDGGMVANFRMIIESGQYQDLADAGNRLARCVFGAETDQISNAIANHAFIAPEASMKLLKIMTPLVLAIAGDERRVHGLNRNGVTSLLENQRNLFASELPSDSLERLGLEDPLAGGSQRSEDDPTLSMFVPPVEEDGSNVPPIKVDDDLESLDTAVFPDVTGRHEMGDVSDVETKECDTVESPLAAEPEGEAAESTPDVERKPNQTVDESYGTYSFSEEVARISPVDLISKAILPVLAVSAIWFYAFTMFGRQPAKSIPTVTPVSHVNIDLSDVDKVAEELPPDSEDDSQLVMIPVSVLDDQESFSDANLAAEQARPIDATDSLDEQLVAAIDVPTDSLAAIVRRSEDPFAYESEVDEAVVGEEFTQVDQEESAAISRDTLEAASAVAEFSESAGGTQDYFLVGTIKVPVFDAPRRSGRSYYTDSLRD